MTVDTKATAIWTSVVPSDIPSYHISLGFGTATVGFISSTFDLYILLF